MTKTVPPSVDPANLDSLTGLLKHVFGKLTQNLDGQLPAKVVYYNRDANRVTVQPLIAVIASDAETITPRALIENIPALILGAGNAGLSFNLEPGDLGWIMASDRDISNFLRSYESGAPNTLRKKSFSDSLFVPDIMRDFKIDSEDKENAVFQRSGGSVRVSLFSDRVKITPFLEVNGPASVAEDLTVSGAIAANNGITISGGGANAVVITGNIKVIGNITATGDITPHVPP